eukprot:TRINITY_DN7309_c0_g1_i1.p1 TRINITY_DN7309_c0_g1~~TRINITY_DN7309_c0_g1_i1.p1  ORF type:complete len:353 (-),score=65.16 TRINITY_DN7309_c0_g1_i1:36-1094(-)
MGQCCSGTSSDPNTMKIDKMLAADRKAMAEEVKILMLGAGESGKSTIFKQMKIIQIDGGFQKDELQAYKFIVYGNCITQMKVLVSAAEQLGIPLEKEENAERAARIAKLFAAGDSWSKEVAEDIIALWADTGIRAVYAQRDKAFQLNDSAGYFFHHTKRFIDDAYVPTIQDVLRARVRTTGIEEAVYSFDDMTFRMIDVGGQRSERRKWIHYFEGVTSVLFVSSLSEYDQTLREDNTHNRMKESLTLFGEICKNPVFQQTPIILFLNKLDLFREKIQTVPITVCFSTFEGPPNDFEEVSKYIRSRFLSVCKSKDRPTYVHFTCAVDTENVDVVMQSVRDALLQDVLKGIGGM